MIKQQITGKEKVPEGGKIEFAKESEFIRQVSGATINSYAYSSSNTHAQPESGEECTDLAGHATESLNQGGNDKQQ